MARCPPTNSLTARPWTWRAALRDQGPTPAADAIRRELVERFHAALEELGEGDREILIMRHFEHLSNAESAAALGLSEPAAGMRYLRALRRLARFWPGGRIRTNDHELCTI